jgi:hypothetical protein
MLTHRIHPSILLITYHLLLTTNCFCIQYFKQMKNLPNFRTSLSASLYTLSTILLLCIANTATAQNEYFEGNPNWNLNIESLGGGINMDYYVCDDSTINEFNYKRIGCIEHSWCDEPFFSSLNINNDQIWLCLVRSAGKEMFWHNPETGQDELLYRFEGEIGDTLHVHQLLKYDPGDFSGIDNRFFIIDAVDSILIGDNYRKTFHTAEEWSPDMNFILEGIGSHSGPLSFMSNLVSELNCFSWLGVEYVYDFSNGYQYDNLIPGECVYISVSEFSSAELKISPNPASDFISLEYPTKSNISTIQIVDMNGRILRETNASQFNNSIDISEYPSGIYVVRLIGKDSVAYAKFMIEK